MNIKSIRQSFAHSVAMSRERPVWLWYKMFYNKIGYVRVCNYVNLELGSAEVAANSFFFSKYKSLLLYKNNGSVILFRRIKYRCILKNLRLNWYS